MAGRKQQLAREATEQHGSIATAARACERLYDALKQIIDRTARQQVATIEQEYERFVQRARSERDGAIRGALDDTQRLLDAGIPDLLGWSDPRLTRWQPSPDGRPPSMVRLGEIRPTHLKTPIPPLPALLPIIGSGHVLVKSSEALTATAATVVQQLAWRLAALSPPPSFRFALFDPLDRGTNLASLLALPEEIRGERIYCQDEDITKALKQTAQEIEDITQKRLGYSHRSIESYNASNPTLAVPYHLVVFLGFPRGFTPEAAALLMSIARTGLRTGHYLLGAILSDARMPHDFDLASLERDANILTVQGPGAVSWNDPDLSRFPVFVDQPPSDQTVAVLAERVARGAEQQDRAAVDFASLTPPRAKWWRGRSDIQLDIQVGMAESGKPYLIELGTEFAHHALVGGTTGSGKTTALHVLITMLALTYSPEELELYLVDFKEGVEFQDYVTHRLPHVRAVVLEAEREFGASILQHLTTEMTRRAQLYKDADARKLQDYRSRTGVTLPRILLIIDEYTVLFAETDALAQRATELLHALVTQGRAYGIHILLSAQRPGSSFLSAKNIKEQMGLRVALRCGLEDSELILGQRNFKASELTRPGESYITTNPNSVAAAQHVRIAQFDPDERAGYLRQIAQLDRQVGSAARREPPVVFNRTAPASWLDNRAVTTRLTQEKWRAMRAPMFWLGRPVSIDEDLAVALEPRQQSNLLIAGTDEAIAMRSLLVALLGIFISVPPQCCRVTFVGSLDSDQVAGTYLSALRQNARHPLHIYNHKPAVNAVAELAVELKRRTEIPGADRNTWRILVIGGIHAWSEVRPSGYQASPTAEQLAQLWRLGPAVGIHTVLWTDRLASISATLGQPLFHDALAQFGHRVAMQMPADESASFIGAPDAAQLGEERALYRYERNASHKRDKFKPYALPSMSEMRTILGKLRTGWPKA